MHGSIAATCETYAQHVLQLTEDDIVFGRVLFHAYGLGNALSFPFSVGAATVLQPGRPTPRGILDAIERYRPSVLCLVPTLYNAILNENATSDLSSVRRCISAAEPLAPETWRRWKATFWTGDSRRHWFDRDATYFLLEYGGNLPAWFERQGGAGIRIENCGWLKVSGEWVSPIEMENVLLEHAAVNEAAVVGVTIDGVMRIRAVIILNEAETATLKTELQEWCKQRLQRYQYPHRIDFVTELPKTASGKIQRFKLREE